MSDTGRKRVAMRMDFVFDVLAADDETRTMQIALRPDPRRYVSCGEGRETYYVDQYTNSSIGIDAVDDLMRQAAGMPLHFLGPSIGDAEKYAASRFESVEHELKTGEHIIPAEHACQHFQLDASTSAWSERMTFVSVDVCGSTSSRAKNPDRFDAAMNILIRELGTVVGQFRGRIFKLTGDGFIAYLRHPSANSMCDATVDMCLTFLTVLRGAINPALERAGFDQFAIRVGAEFGEADIKQISIPSTGYKTTDISSDALNIASKVQGGCDLNELRVGERLRSLLHVQWLERTERVGDFSGRGVFSVR